MLLDLIVFKFSAEQTDLFNWTVRREDAKNNANKISFIKIMVNNLDI